jgi:hypothetical protein
LENSNVSSSWSASAFCRIPLEALFAADVHDARVTQFLEVVRELGDAEARLGADGG